MVKVKDLVNLMASKDEEIDRQLIPKSVIPQEYNNPDDERPTASTTIRVQGKNFIIQQ